MKVSPLAATLPLALSLFAGLAWADPPPKLCLVVVGDADPTLVAAARSLQQLAGSQAELRTIADEATRNALLGGVATDEPEASLARLRRALQGTDADAASLEQLGTRLGCTLALEVSARPAGFSGRAFDLRTHRFGAPWDDSAVGSAWLTRALGPAALPPPPPGAVVAPLAPAAVAPAPAPAGGASAVLTPVRPSSAVPAAGAPSRPPLLGPTELPGDQTRPPAVGTVRAQSGGFPWPWLLAGGAAVALVGVFLGVQFSQPGPVVIDVSRAALSSSGRAP